MVTDYDQAAALHRPTDPVALASEIRRLARENHLTARDIAVALRLDIAFVLESLNQSKET